MPDSSPDNRFKDLLGRLLDDDPTADPLSDDEFSEFTALVKAHPEFSAELRLQLLMDSRLAQYENAGHNASSFVTSVEAALDAEVDGEDFVNRVVQMTDAPPKRQVNGVPWAVAITSLAACLAFAALWIASNRNTASEEITPGVAVIESLVGEIEHDESNRVEGDSVGPGILELDGFASLEFYKGAQVTVAGPAKLELVDPQRIICHFGKIRASVPPMAKGFTVVTAESEIVDLGTEFAMEVGPTGQTEVHVFHGEVEAYDADRSPSSKKLLTAGKGVKIRDANDWESIPAQSERFSDLANISQLARDEESRRLRAWKELREAMQEDSRLIAYYDFEKHPTKRRMIENLAPTGEELDGAIVGARRRQGPWPGKAALEFRRPGDRVRIHLPGEYESITLAAWIRVDGLDRTHSSLLLTDGYDPGEIHWQLKREGALTVGVHHGDRKHNYVVKGFMDLSRIGQWMHLTTVIDQDNRTLTHYVDGELFAIQDLRGSGTYSLGDASIGNWDPHEHAANSIRSLNGAIAELMVFGEAIAPDEVRRISLR